MNTTKKLQQAKLDQWTVLCKEQSESGLTVRQWCEQNCKLRLNGTPVPLLRNGYSIFNGTKYR